MTNRSKNEISLKKINEDVQVLDKYQEKLKST